jgi:hypothetical protein
MLTLRGDEARCHVARSNHRAPAIAQHGHLLAQLIDFGPDGNLGPQRSDFIAQCLQLGPEPRF